MTGPMVFALIAAAILVGVPLLWIGAVFWTSRMGGWHSLTKDYRTSFMPAHPVKSGTHLYMKPSRFRVEVTFKLKPDVELSFRKKDYDWIVETRQKLTDKYA